ncbi:MAG: 1-deoxy-D-xylulose-5-phosphate synthase [Clostridiales bacterium]|nr:1-deoxy-D-xylulose-5-phosphate synthase [Clostridiales bacterium]
MKNKSYKYLDKINSPEDLKKLPVEAMPELAREIRHFLIDKVTGVCGGHLASNLGVVELSIALHRVFNSPKDHIIWDVGHQSYVHKILTGRREAFDTLRKPGGLSGFTKRSESEHDPFGAGHSSTSISAALGFAQSDRLSGKDNFTIAVIGDGAFTGGMVHEALNNCDKNLKLIIILNENEMSISKNIGGFAKYIAKIRSSSKYMATKKKTQSLVGNLPLVGKPLYNLMRDTKQTFKNIMYASNYFEEMGLFYLGPADGNDYFTIERLLREAAEKGESVVIHLKTKKGCGYPPAEKQPNTYHSVSVGERLKGQNFSSRFGCILLDLAHKNEKICAITAAMSEGTGLLPFERIYPQRFFDVGIAEEHALTFCAGLAANGHKPFFAVYSSFLQRGYDSIIHDIALQKLPVVICVDRAGLNKYDGATHHGIFDVSFLSHIPDMQIFAPITFGSLETAIKRASQSDLPCAIRYPNGTEDPRIVRQFYPDRDYTEIGVRSNFADPDKNQCVIITYGQIAAEALEAADSLKSKGIRCGVILLELLKPYDKTAELVLPLLPSGEGLVLFLEEGIRDGGAGMLLFDRLTQRSIESEKMKNKTYVIMAIDDHFAIQDKNESIYKTCGISSEDVVARVLRHFEAGGY